MAMYVVRLRPGTGLDRGWSFMGCRGVGIDHLIMARLHLEVEGQLLVVGGPFQINIKWLVGPCWEVAFGKQL